MNAHEPVTPPSPPQRPPPEKAPAAAPAEPRPIVQIGRVLGYFLVLTVGLRMLDAALSALAASVPLDRLARASGVIEKILDVDHNLDELVVTSFTLIITFLLVAPVSWVLKLTRGDEREPSLTQTLIVLSMIVAGVTLLIQDSIARSFGLVGVVAAVRYRNSLKDSKDAVYVFLALGIGMACGLHAYPVAALLSFLECGVLLGMWLLERRAGPSEAELLERLRVAERRGARTPEEALAWLTPEARARLEQDLRTQSRLITMARIVAERSGKRANAALTVEIAAGSSVTRDRVNSELMHHGGGWQLLDAIENGGVATLEYLGRVPRRKSPPVKLIDRLQQADPGVRHVTFRSLRKMVPQKVDAGRPAEAQPPAPRANGAAA